MTSPRTTREDLRQELLAVLGARRELGPEHERELVETFLGQLDQEIDARIEAKLKERGRLGRGAIVLPVAIVAMVLAIPLTAIGAWGGGLIGVLIVWLALGAIVHFASR